MGLDGGSMGKVISCQESIWVHWEGCLLHPPNQNVFISKCLLSEGGRVLWQRGQNSPGMETARRWTISNRGYCCIFHGMEFPRSLVDVLSPRFAVGVFCTDVICFFTSLASLEKTFCLGSQSGTPTHAQLSRAVSPGCWWALIWWHYRLFALSVGQFRF